MTPWTVAYQASPSMGFFRQEYWNGLPFPSLGDLPDPGIEPGSPVFQADALTSEPPGKAQECSNYRTIELISHASKFGKLSSAHKTGKGQFSFQSQRKAMPKNVQVKVKLLSRLQLFATPWTVDYQARPSMGFSRQEYWSGLPFPSPGDLPDPGIEPRSPTLTADALTSEPPGKPFRWPQNTQL